MLTVLFIALFVAWEYNGELLDCDAPVSVPNIKNFEAQVSMEKPSIHAFSNISSPRIASPLKKNKTVLTMPKWTAIFADIIV